MWLLIILGVSLNSPIEMESKDACVAAARALHWPSNDNYGRLAICINKVSGEVIHSYQLKK